MGAPSWDDFADLALKRLAASGAEYGDIRIVHSTTQTIRGEDRRIASIRDNDDVGFGVRVLYHGGWGFAASSILSLEEVPRVTELAIDIARGSASIAVEKVVLAREPVHRDRVVTPVRIDPFTVPLRQKTELLLATMELLQAQSGVVRSSAGLWVCRDHKLFASIEGTRLEFDLLASSGDYTATALHEGRFASRSFNTPQLRRGYELIEEADFLGQAPRVAREAVEKVRAPS
jgi:TldD protein